MFVLDIIDLSELLVSSLPIRPTSVTSIPKSARFFATFAAPPGLSKVSAISTTGTGASGEILLTLPAQYLSNITSPRTNIFFFSIINRLYQTKLNQLLYFELLP